MLAPAVTAGIFFLTHLTKLKTFSMRVQTLVTAACLAFLAPLNASQLDLAFLTPPNTSPREMTALGRKYLNGVGVKQSDGEALRWFHAAATKGEGNAHYLIGWMHEVGRAAQKSLPVASEWYLNAAKLGDADGMNATGRALENGWAGKRFRL